MESKPKSLDADNEWVFRAFFCRRLDRVAQLKFSVTSRFLGSCNTPEQEERSSVRGRLGLDIYLKIRRNVGSYLYPLLPSIILLHLINRYPDSCYAYTKTVLGSRAFSVAGLKLWNSLLAVPG